MLTRSDCWEPLEPRPFIHLRRPARLGQPRRSGVVYGPILRPTAVSRVIRRIRGLSRV